MLYAEWHSCKKHINDFAWSPELVRFVDVEQYRKLLLKTNTGLPVAASTIHRTRLAANFPLSPTINPNFNYYSRPVMSSKTSMTGISVCSPALVGILLGAPGIYHSGQVSTSWQTPPWLMSWEMSRWSRSSYIEEGAPSSNVLLYRQLSQSQAWWSFLFYENANGILLYISHFYNFFLFLLATLCFIMTNKAGRIMPGNPYFIKLNWLF